MMFFYKSMFRIESLFLGRFEKSQGSINSAQLSEIDTSQSATASVA